MTPAHVVIVYASGMCLCVRVRVWVRMRAIVAILTERLRYKVASLKISCGVPRARCQLHVRKLSSSNGPCGTNGSKSATVYMHGCRKRLIGGR